MSDLNTPFPEKDKGPDQAPPLNQDGGNGFASRLFQKAALDAELAEWFFLNLVFAALPLGLALLFRKVHHVEAVEVTANIPEISFLVIMVCVTAAGDIRKVFSGKIHTTASTTWFWTLLSGGVIFSAFLGTHLWNEVAFADDYQDAVIALAKAALHQQPLIHLMQNLTFAQSEYEKNKRAELEVLDILKWLSGIYVVLSVLAELFVARARKTEKEAADSAAA